MWEFKCTRVFSISYNHFILFNSDLKGIWVYWKLVSLIPTSHASHSLLKHQAEQVGNFQIDMSELLSRKKEKKNTLKTEKFEREQNLNNWKILKALKISCFFFIFSFHILIRVCCFHSQIASHLSISNFISTHSIVVTLFVLCAQSWSFPTFIYDLTTQTNVRFSSRPHKFSTWNVAVVDGVNSVEIQTGAYTVCSIAHLLDCFFSRVCVCVGGVKMSLAHSTWQTKLIPSNWVYKVRKIDDFELLYCVCGMLGDPPAHTHKHTSQCANCVCVCVYRHGPFMIVARNGKTWVKRRRSRHIN